MPRLKIHCWGGVGSQLYALAVYEKLLDRMPNRKFIFIFHNGGVTERQFELSNYVHEVYIEKDYHDANFNSNQKTDKAKYLSSKFNLFLKFILLKFGILATANNEFEYMKIKPWVLTLRGHYSDINIPKHIVNKIWNNINSTNKVMKELSGQSILCVQIRLGDLLTIDSKNPTDSLIVINKICELLQKYEIRKILVFSDSSQIALGMLKSKFNNIEIFATDFTALDTILALSKSNLFLGTSSKISIWATIFNLSLNNSGLIFLPSNLSRKVEGNLVGDSRGSLVEYYSVN